MQPEYVTIRAALDAIEIAIQGLREKDADINYLSMDDLMANVKRTRESFKVVTMSRKIEPMIEEEAHGKLD